MAGIDLFRLDGRVAIITGGTKGLGRSMAAALASAGANLVICSRHGDEARAAASDLADELASAIHSHSPEVSLVPDRWVPEIDRLLRLGTPGGPASPVDPEEVARVIRWAHVDDPSEFWRPNLLSGKKLRLHFDRLRVQAKTRRNGSGGGRLESPEEIAARLYPDEGRRS